MGSRPPTPSCRPSAGPSGAHLLAHQRGSLLGEEGTPPAPDRSATHSAPHLCTGMYTHTDVLRRPPFTAWQPASPALRNLSEITRPDLELRANPVPVITGVTLKAPGCLQSDSGRGRLSQTPFPGTSWPEVPVPQALPGGQKQGGDDEALCQALHLRPVNFL